MACEPKASDTAILWRRGNGQVLLTDREAQDRGFSSGTNVDAPDPAWTIRGIGDFDGDGHDDVLFRSAEGRTLIWFMNKGRKTGEASGSSPGLDWAVQGIGDFDGDGRADILWRSASGVLAFSSRGTDWNDVSAPVSPGWGVAAIGDFNGDAHADILWRHSTGRIEIWFMSGTRQLQTSSRNAQGPGASWTVQGVGDFDGDGRDDVLWRDRSAPWGLSIWFDGDEPMEGPRDPTNLHKVGDGSWSVAAIGDFNRDGDADILWRKADGTMVLWFCAGASFIRARVWGTSAGNEWQIQGLMRDDT